MSAFKLLPVTGYEEYLRDESRLAGHAAWICFPETEQEVAELLCYAGENGLAVTVQGSRTGIAGASVPQGGIVLNLTKLNHIGAVTQNADNRWTVTVGAGVLADQLAEHLRRHTPKLMFPPDPTEGSATLGGMFGCNAKGVCSYRYGATADWVRAVQLVQEDASTLTIDHNTLVNAESCVLPDGRQLTLPMLDNTPCGVPCLPYQGQSLLELLCGSEGMLGIATSLTLELLELPAEQWGVLFFFGTTELAFAYIAAAEAVKGKGICCLEFYDQASLDLVSSKRAVMSRLKSIPDFPQGSRAAVYTEIATADSEAAEELLMLLLGSFEELGGVEEQSWAATGWDEMEKFRLLRHAVPEAVNMEIDRLRRTLPQLHKLGLDFACRSLAPEALYTLYHDALQRSGLQGVIFGHAADCHLHVNLIPSDEAQLAIADALVDELAAVLVAHGGVLTEENGIGKLKGGLVGRHLTHQQRETVAQLRSFFAPRGLLNPGNMHLEGVSL